MRALPLLLVLLAVAPTALAQGVDVSIAALPGPVVPVEGPARTDVTVRIACSDLPRDAALSLSAQHRETWITTTIEPSQARPDRSACDGEYVLHANLTATLAADAPAFEESVVQVGALLRGGDGVASGSQTTRVKVGFYSAVRLAAAKENASGAGGSIVTFPLVVANEGNGLVKVGFEVLAKNGSVQVAIPPSVVVEPFGNQTVQVQAIAPKEKGASDFTLVATPAYAYDPTLRGTDASIVLRVLSDARAPGPGLAALLVALILVGKHFRRPLH